MAFRQVQAGADDGETQAKGWLTTLLYGEGVKWDPQAHDFIRQSTKFGKPMLDSAPNGDPVYAFYATPDQKQDSSLYANEMLENMDFYVQNNLTTQPTPAAIEAWRLRQNSVRKTTETLLLGGTALAAAPVFAAMAPEMLAWVLANPYAATEAGIIVAEEAAAIVSGAVTVASVSSTIRNSGKVISVDTPSPSTVLPNNWKLSIGSKIDDPSDKIGHAAIRLEGPNGFSVTKGKWPIMEDGTPGFSDIVSPIKGMKGSILDDSTYVKSSGDKFIFQDYSIDVLQAKKAWSVIKSELRAGQNGVLQYKLFSDQCTTFACSVVKSAGEKPPYAGYPKRPTKLYDSINKAKK